MVHVYCDSAPVQAPIYCDSGRVGAYTGQIIELIYCYSECYEIVTYVNVM